MFSKGLKFVQQEVLKLCLQNIVNSGHQIQTLVDLCKGKYIQWFVEYSYFNPESRFDQLLLPNMVLNRGSG